MRTFAAKYLLLFGSVLLLFAGAAVCQNPVSYLNDANSPAYSVNIPVPNGYINVANGNLHLEIPLAAPPQRGALKVSERLVYDSRIWMFSPFGSHGSYHWWPYNVVGSSGSSGGWRLVKGNEVGNISTAMTNYYSNWCTQAYYGAPSSSDSWYTYSFTWTDPSGMTHPFSATETYEDTDCWTPAPPTINAGGSTDGSGYWLADDGYGNPVITDSIGKTVYPWVADRYGNQLGSDTSGNLIDDNGRTPVIANTSGSTTYYNVLAPNGTPMTGGTRVQYTVTTAPVSVSTGFGWSLGGGTIYEWVSPSGLTPIQTIQLPDGTSYSFSYDGYGELSSMTLPTGGTVTFGYSNVADVTNTPNRWITSYAVGGNPPTTFQPWPGNCFSGAGCTQAVYMDRPSGDETRYFFNINNGAWNTTTLVYSGNPGLAGGNPPVETTNVNTYSNPCTTYPCNGANYLTGSLSTTALITPSGGATYSQTYSTFDSFTGKPTAVKQWDLAVGSWPSTPPSTTPDRETDYAYTASPYSGMPYDPLSITVMGRSTAGAQIQVSKTTYGYTTSAAAPSTTPAEYYPTGASVSYPHTITNWLNTNSSA